MRKVATVYRSGQLYLVQRGRRYFIHGTYEGQLIRVAAKTNDLETAKIALNELETQLLSGWREDPIVPVSPREREVSLSSAWPLVAKTLWNRHYHAAKKRDLLFQISESDVYDLMEESNFRCSVSGIPFSRRISRETTMDPWAPSIDRIENRHGYLKDNIRIVCVVANLAMNQWGYDTLLRLARSVVSNASHVKTIQEFVRNGHGDEHKTPEVIENTNDLAGGAVLVEDAATSRNGATLRRVPLSTLQNYAGLPVNEPKTA